MSTPPISVGLENLRADIRREGFSAIAASQHQRAGSEAWLALAQSFDRLPQDNYMGDAGRYRRRRFGVFELSASGVHGAPHQPHFQSTLYNRLNGGIERWFDAIEADIASGAELQHWLRWCFDLFAPLRPEVSTWHTELHQFRVQTSSSELGKPTPEGVHRDGVDFVLVMLLRRVGIRAGVTRLHDNDGTLKSQFTLENPGDLVVLDDQRLLHAVTPIEAIGSEPGFRDVVVITLRAK